MYNVLSHHIMTHLLANFDTNVSRYFLGDVFNEENVHTRGTEAEFMKVYGDLVGDGR